ncbi:phosphotransferase, partial [uncultured Duncaniella sp.]|uniref:aminoglycoside phosphotransferase family protein n=1 Tax=uncultured Duncaniella sp. TaxID=2768039 RepID=UPI0025B1777F
MKQLNELYRRYTGKDAEQVKLLTPAGSSRKYYRLSGRDGEVSLIGVAGTDCKENEAFIYLSRHFYEKGLPVPRVLAVSDDGMCYLESDLGDVSLFALKGDEGLLEKAVRTLARFHYEGSDGMDYTKCFPVDAFDRQSVMWDLNYFKYSFLNTSGISYSEPRLEADMVRLAEDVDRVTRDESRFMLRDFQSRNVMVKDGEVYFIDYQGGRRGPSAYDLASFLWQAKAGFSHELRERLIEVYADEARRYDDVDAEMLKQQVRSMALIRTLQVMGAYGLRGRFERKPHFLQSIPLALGNLRSLLDEGIGDYPYLNEMLPRLIEAGKGIGVGDDGFEGLTVRVCSFSFKKGIPEDPSGNGGG